MSNLSKLNTFSLKDNVLCLCEGAVHQSKANVTNANSCFVSRVLGADKKWSGSKGNRVKGFCILFFKHCMMSSLVNIAWSLCLSPSFVSNLELCETPKATDADSFGSVSSEILMFFF